MKLVNKNKVRLSSKDDLFHDAILLSKFGRIECSQSYLAALSPFIGQLMLTNGPIEKAEIVLSNITESDFNDLTRLLDGSIEDGTVFRKIPEIFQLLQINFSSGSNDVQNNSSHGIKVADVFSLSGARKVEIDGTEAKILGSEDSSDIQRIKIDEPKEVKISQCVIRNVPPDDSLEKIGKIAEEDILAIDNLDELRRQAIEIQAPFKIEATELGINASVTNPEEIDDEAEILKIDDLKKLRKHVAEIQEAVKIEVTEQEIDQDEEDMEIDADNDFFGDHVDFSDKEEIDERISEEKVLRRSGRKSKKAKIENKSGRESNQAKLENKSFECDKCHKRFVSRAGLISHMKTHLNLDDPTLNTKPLEKFCPVCQESLSAMTYYQAKMHVAKHSPPSIKCDHCSMLFYLNKTMKTHMKSYHSNPNQKTFTCSVKDCLQTFGKQEQLENHAVDHMEESDVFTCDLCGKKFPSKDNLVKHQQQRMCKSVECKICRKTFNQEGIRKHMMRRHKTRYRREISCPKDGCEKVFHLHSAMTNHALMEHQIYVPQIPKGTRNAKQSAYKKRTCPVCQAELQVHQRTYDKHVAKHAPPTIQCKLCPKMLYTKHDHILHLRNNHVVEECKPIRCDQCPRAFLTKGQLDRHMFQSHHSKEDAHMCTSCQRVYDSQEKLDLHKRKPCNLTCRKCGTRFENVSELTKHRKAHYRITKCPECQEEFENQIVLKKHLLFQHKKVASNKSEKSEKSINTKKQEVETKICPVCSKVIKLFRKTSFPDHMSRHEAPGLQCTFCEKRFYHQRQLQGHIKQEHVTDDVRHECPECKEEFVNKSLLKIHHNSKHPTIVVCGYCGESMNQASLKRHEIRNHLESLDRERVKVFECNICPKLFANKFLIDKHMKMHSDPSMFECAKCKAVYGSSPALAKHMKLEHKKQ